MSEDTMSRSAVEELAELEKQEAEEAALAAKGKAEEDARRELANRKAIREAKARFPGEEIRRVDTDAGMVLIRTPSPDQFDRFNRLALDPDTKIGANKTLAFAGKVHPDDDTLEEWGRKKPAIYNSIAARVIELAGSDTTVKKV